MEIKKEYFPDGRLILKNTVTTKAEQTVLISTVQINSPLLDELIKKSDDVMLKQLHQKIQEFQQYHFETMVFDENSGATLDSCKYKTEQEALEGHKLTIERCMNHGSGS